MVKGAWGQRRVTHGWCLLSSLVQEPLQEQGSLLGNLFLILPAPCKSQQERNNIKVDEVKISATEEKGPGVGGGR